VKTHTFIFYDGEAVGLVPFTVDYTVTITVDGDREHAWKAFKKLVNAYMPGEDGDHVDVATFYENGAYDKDLRLVRLQIECGILELDIVPNPLHAMYVYTYSDLRERHDQ
jgi:hypothetical protein